MRASRKGLSPLLAIIIGLIVTIVAGILLAQLYFSYAATLSQRPAANVEYVDLVVTGTNTGTLVLNIKNTGNVPITEVHVKGIGDSASGCQSSETIPSGRVRSISCQVSWTDTTIFAWNGSVSVIFADGSNQTYLISARPRYA